MHDFRASESNPAQTILPDMEWYRLNVGRFGKRHNRVPSALRASTEVSAGAGCPPVTTITTINLLVERVAWALFFHIQCI